MSNLIHMSNTPVKYFFSHHERKFDSFGCLFFVAWYTDGNGGFTWINA